MTETIPDLEEQQAISQLKHGDLNGLELLVKRYQVRAVYASFLILHDAALAEDVVQSAFLRAAEKIAQFDERRSFQTWFFKIVINASLRAAQQQKRLVSYEESAEAEGETITGLEEWLMDPHPGPLETVEAQEFSRAVWKALDQLPAEQRAVIVMRHFLKMNETEMTTTLHRPLTTVRWWLRSAKERLRGLLLPFWDAEPRDREERGREERDDTAWDRAQRGEKHHEH